MNIKKHNKIFATCPKADQGQVFIICLNDPPKGDPLRFADRAGSIGRFY